MRGNLFRATLGAALILSGLAGSATAREPGQTDRSALLAELGADRISRHAETGQVRFVRGTAAQPAARTAILGRPATPRTAARNFMARYGSLFGVPDAASQLRVARVTDADGRATFVRYQQVHEGVPVLGGDLHVQVDAAGNVISANGEASPRLALDVAPRFTAAAALREALAMVSKTYGLNEADLSASTPQLWIYDPALLGGPGLPFARLVWRMDVTNRAGDLRELVLIDAARGTVALHFNQIAEAKNRITCDANNSATKYPCTAALAARTESSGASAVADVNNAHNFSGHTYDFFFKRFGRDSLDGAGMAIISTVRYCDPSSPCPYANAFWDGDQMVYGAGFASADDVVGHELAHGVTDHTSGLYYYYQSGAINEALSDIFGEFGDLTNGAGTDTAAVRWLMGEDVPGFGALRDMEHPPTFGNPDRMQSSIYWDSLDDNGGVHINSGVANKAAFLMVDGQTFNGQTVTGIGIDKTAAVWYRVEANYLGTASDYADLGAALKQACTDLVGASVKNSAGTVTGTIGSGDCTQVARAVTATEMALQPTSPNATAPDAPICTSGSPSNVLYDQIASGAPGWTQTGTVGNSYGWYYGDWYATSPLYHLYGYMDNGGTPPAFTRTSATAIPANAFLHFRHAYEFEQGVSTNYDGGVLEYSTNNGTSWTSASALFSHNGHNGTITSGFGNPLEGKSAFVGISHGYVSSRLNLSSLSGLNVKFRFRISSDSSIGWQGWYIDDFRIYTCTTGDTTPPSRTAPVQRFVVPGAVSGGSGGNIPVRLTWTASDAGSGLASTQLQRSLNGGSYTNIALASATAKQYNMAVAASTTTTYRFRDRATDVAGNVSTFATGPLFKVRAFQENAAAITYPGSWTNASSSSFYGGALRHSSITGRSATFTCTGRDLAFVSTKAANRGRVEITLDGGTPQIVDLYRSSVAYRQIVWAAHFAGAVSHSVKVRVLGTRNAASTGNRVDLDAFLCIGA
ncbi:hypothetical protein BH20CHL6_BH20CHL6_11860 [soil metagenome]